MCGAIEGVPRNDFAKKHDLIFRYAKGKTATFNVDDVRIPYSESVTSSSASRYDKSYRSNKVYSGYRPNDKGKHPEDWWAIQPLMPSDRTERTGWPTQKPLALYERIVKASSNLDDIVFDPFAGCATTLVAAERFQRQWVGMDIWKGARKLVEQRLADTTGLFGDVTFTDQPPERTDDRETASPFLRGKQKVKEPDGPRWTRAEMYSHLLDQSGPRCMGCDRVFDDPRYLELDHNTPRSDGGLNHISNRVLLCGPCNRLKSNTFTLSGLRRENGKRGYMCVKKGEQNDRNC